MIVYHAADLFWASKIKGTAEAIGLQARPVRNPEMLEARLADSPVRALMVDLDAPEAALALIRRLRGPAAGDRERAVRVLAYGPHVAAEAFRAAREAGADVAMARGGLDANLSRVLRDLAGVPSGPPGEEPSRTGGKRPSGGVD